MVWTIISGLVVGILLGFVMQRTRFCLAGGFRDMYVQKSNKMFYALLIAITVQSIGLLILKHLNIIEVPAETFPVIELFWDLSFWNRDSISWRMRDWNLV